MQKIYQFLNWLNWIGGLRDESNMFETGDPFVNSAFSGWDQD